MKRFFVYILCLMAVAQASATTETLATESHSDVLAHWEVGNSSYVNGDYAKAIEEYRAILDGGHYSVRLYYNLANAYFKAGDTANAILFYHRALQISPADEDIRHNLALAEAQTKDRIAEVPELFITRWVRTVRNLMSCTAWSIFSIVSFALLVAFGLVFLLARGIANRKLGFWGAFVALLLFVASTSFAVSERNEILTRDRAVVMSSALSVKSSPDRSATDLFVLHEGTLLRIISTWGDWSEISIADGKKGWVESKSIEQI
jgi:tetratricopeptide (TPR) repeat protein